MADDDKHVVISDREPPEPPVVARLVVEIRSDGTRTIARGAIQDAALGQEVAIKAEGTTPLALALSLARSLLKAPFLSRAFGGALRSLAGRRDRRADPPDPPDPPDRGDGGRE